MSNTPQPKLRTKPPKLPDAAAAMRRLEALDEWTEKPARDAAAALGERKEEAKPSIEKPKAKPKKAADKKDDKPSEQGAPWDVIDGGDNGSIKPCSFRLPMTIYKQLVWLSGTTLGYDQTRIVKEALAEKIDKMLRERGIMPHGEGK